MVVAAISAVVVLGATYMATSVLACARVRLQELEKKTFILFRNARHEQI